MRSWATSRLDSGVEAGWEEVLAGYRHYLRDRRDRDRIHALYRAAAGTGFLDALTEAFAQVCRGREPRFEGRRDLPWLTTAERLDLITTVFGLCEPIRVVTYPSHGTIEPGSEVAELGLDVDALYPDHHQRPPPSRVFPHQEAMLRDRGVELISPLSGRRMRSAVSLLQLSGTGRPTIVFHFIDDGEPFLLFTSSFDGRWTDWLFPDRNLMVCLSGEALHGLAAFRALMTEFAAQTVTHFNYEGARELALLVGTTHHFGHSVLNEYEAFHQCCEAGLLEGVDLVLRGPANFFPHTALFPELADTPVLQIHDCARGYRTVAEGHLLLARPTCSYRFSAGLRKRLTRVGRDYRVSYPCSRLVEAERRWPLLWIEIRAHDRRWADQEQQLPHLIDNLAREFPRLGVVMAGWSRMIDPNPVDWNMIRNDAALVATITDAVTAEIQIFDITGVGTLEKLTWALACDAFLATSGTGLVFPCYAGGSPGVVHTNSAYIKLYNRSPRGELRVDAGFNAPVSISDLWLDLRVIGPEHIRDEDPGQPAGIRNHCLDWRPAYEQLMLTLRTLAPRE